MLTERLRSTIELIYTGRSRVATRFRYALIVFDICTIGFFVATAPLDPTPDILIVDMALGTAVLADFLARLWIAPSKPRMLRQICTIADILVIPSLLLAPIIAQNLVFLRVLRALRLLHSYHVLRDLRRDTPFFRRNEDVIVNAVNLGVFIFLVTALVFALQFGDNPDIGGFIDALYFTVGTLTTTGFGDITLTGDTGRLLSVAIMVVGVVLFLRLAQSLVRPRNLTITCSKCGLERHEPDAIHYRRCGRALATEESR